MEKHRLFTQPSRATACTFVLLSVAAHAGPRFEVTDLGSLDASSTFSQAMAVNDSAAVAGFSSISGNSAFRAISCLSTPGVAPLELDTLVGSSSQGFDINGAGELAGLSYMTGDTAYRADI